MRKELKDQHIDALCEEIKAYPSLYIADIGGLNSVQTSKLRRAAFRKEVKLEVVKNTLLIKALEKSGFDYSELFPVIKGGWTDVDVIITMPSCMPKIGALGRILGPRGLMPNPKTGTVTMEVGKAVQEAKAGKIDFKVDKFGIIHTAVAKCSFDDQKIVENAREVLQMIMKLKPSAAKGTYVKSIAISSTMSPGVKVDTKAATL